MESRKSARKIVQENVIFKNMGQSNKATLHPKVNIKYFFSKMLRHCFGSWFPIPTLMFAVMEACTLKEFDCRMVAIIPAWQVMLLGQATRLLLLMCTVRSAALLHFLLTAAFTRTFLLQF